MAELISATLDVGAIYHDLLFAYQRAQRLYHGQRGTNFVHQSTISFLLNIEKQGKLEIENCKTFEEAVLRFADFLKKGRVIKSLTVEELEPDQYSARVEGCIFAGKVHNFVNLKDATCPFALVVMSFYNKFKGKLANEAESEYFLMEQRQS